MAKHWRNEKMKLYNKAKGKCFYCKRTTRVQTNKRNQVSLDWDATVDHRYSKNDIRRHIKGMDKKIVLCCFKCNQDRNKKERYLIYKDYKDYPIIDIRTLLHY